MDLRARAARDTNELRLANEQLARVHMGGDYAAAIRWLDTCGATYPGFSREHTRIALHKNDIVGGLRLNTDTIRIGEARLKMGGIGWVTTVEQYRGKGICRVLMDDALGYMRQHGYHVSMLFGIPDFYHRWGYVTTLADYSIMVDTMEALTFKNGLTVRAAKPGDIGAIRRMHAADDGDVACSIVRGEAHFSCRWDLIEGLNVLTDEKGKVLAYYHTAVRGDHLAVLEAGSVEPGVCGAILGAVAELADEHALGHIRFHAPPSSTIARSLLLCKSRHEMRLDRDADGMMVFMDVGETLETMVPEWEALVARTAVSQYRTEVTLFVDGVPYRIRGNRGAIDVAQTSGTNKISVSQGDLMHLVTGYRYPMDVLLSGRFIIAPEARDLFGVLFPKRTPYVWKFDRF